jgi:2-keto-4-pentenoate hydratase
VTRAEATRTTVLDEGLVDRLARRLDAAWESGETIAPLTETEGLDRAGDAYAIQSRWTARRVAGGDQVIGRKIGLTSQAMRDFLGVHEPDYGTVWGSRHFAPEHGVARMPHGVFIQPRLEGEIAFLIGERLPRSGVEPQQVLAATQALAVSVEIIDSRITDWRIKLADTIADNASYGALAVGPWSSRLLGTDLTTLGMRIHRDGETLVDAVGAASMGHPARAVAWLANKLGSFGLSLEPGDIVLSGSLGTAIPASRGETFTVEMHEQPPLTVTFE